MITVLNRKEVHVGHSVEKFNKARIILKNNNIDYIYKLLEQKSAYLFSSRRARQGTYGEDSNYSIEYYIYVHKKNYAKAMYLLKDL